MEKDTEKVVYIDKFSEKKQRETGSDACIKINKHQTNPIMKKTFLLSIRDNSIKFTVSDLFN